MREVEVELELVEGLQSVGRKVECCLPMRGVLEVLGKAIVVVGGERRNRAMEPVGSLLV